MRRKTSTDKLPDLLKKNLRLVFVGTAASEKSAEAKAYYAHPGNRFWPALFQAGITSKRYEPAQFRALVKLGIGFTDLCKSSAGMDHKISSVNFDISNFEAKMRMYRPRMIAFTSKKAASIFYKQRTARISVGLQTAKKDFPDVFVLPSPSGAASGYWDLGPWRELATLIEA